MIILLTGAPGVGKSTVIGTFVEQYKEPATWVVTASIPRPEGGRAGFAATNSKGETRIISHKTDIASNIIVGKNHVDVAAVDHMFAKALHTALSPDDTLTIVDEIGPIQLLSPAFNHTLQEVFASHAVNLLATIHYNDERLREYRDSPAALLLEVTQENRDSIPDLLLLILQHRRTIERLPQSAKTRVFHLLRAYTQRNQPLQVQKLLQHAIRYASQRRVHATSTTSWQVKGDHGEYRVSNSDNHFACTCDLFHGRGKYVGRAGECSHIQAVRLISTHSKSNEAG